MTFDQLLALNSKVFHSGFYYITVSLIFIVFTALGYKVLLEIRDELRKQNEDWDND